MAVLVGTYALRPSTATDGDIYIPIDSFYDFLIWSNAAWNHILNGIKCTVPDDSKFSWVNQGGASAVTVNGGVYLAAPVSQDDNLRLRVQAAPSTPYILTGAILPALPGADYNGTGLMWREEETGKTTGIILAYSTRGVVAVPRYDTPTSVPTSPITSLGLRMLQASAIVWLQLEDDGTNRYFRLSGDGINFVTTYSEDRTTYLTPTQIGWHVNTKTNAYSAGGTLIHWNLPGLPDGIKGRNYGFWGLGAIGSPGGPNAGIFGD